MVARTMAVGYIAHRLCHFPSLTRQGPRRTQRLFHTDNEINGATFILQFSRFACGVCGAAPGGRRCAAEHYVKFILIWRLEPAEKLGAGTSPAGILTGLLSPSLSPALSPSSGLSSEWMPGPCRFIVLAALASPYFCTTNPRKPALSHFSAGRRRHPSISSNKSNLRYVFPGKTILSKKIIF